MGERGCVRDSWILLSDSSDRFAVEFREGALSYAKACGLGNVRLVGEDGVLSLVRSYGSGGRVQFGVIGRIRDAAVMSELHARGVRCILWGEDELARWQESVGAPVTTCASDHRAIGRMAADYLVEQDRFRSYVYAEARSKAHWHWWSDQRFEGYVQGMQLQGVKDRIHRVSVLGDVPSADLRELQELLNGLPKPIAVFCCNDRVAHAVLSCCEVAALHVPEDVALLGVDDAQEICEHASVPLSSIRVDWHELGGLSLRVMDDLLRGRPARNEILRCKPVKVVERASTRTAAAVDPFVARAVRLIDTAPNGRLTIERIVTESGASRSYLERHFKAVTGATLHAYLEESILREVQYQLMTTDLPVTCIASSMGYESPSYLCTKFRRRFGVTMQSYRRSCSVI